jgi:hypothetical protein
LYFGFSAEVYFFACSHHCHGASDYILSIVDKGYGIPFKQDHKKAFLNNNKSSRENVDFVEAEIKKYEKYNNV